MKKLLFVLLLALSLFIMYLPSAVACPGKAGGDCDPSNCQHHKEGAHHAQDQAASADIENMALDPICGMKIHKDHAVEQIEYEGKTYYFCMKEEKEAFLKEPGKYITH